MSGRARSKRFRRDASMGAGRSGRSRSAGPAAGRGRLPGTGPRRYTLRGARPGAMGAQPVGASQFLARIPRGPQMSGLENKLMKLGLPIQKFCRFNSIERFHITPDSGHCFWGGVPYYLKQGTTVTPQASFSAQLNPSNCDLFDCARKIQETFGVGAVGAGFTNQNISLDKMVRTRASDATFGDNVQQFDGQELGVAVTAQVGLGNAEQVRQWVVRSNEVSITMENTSTLDAFVEQYELTYTMPKIPLIALSHERGAAGSFSSDRWNRGIGTPGGGIPLSSTLGLTAHNYPTCFDVRDGLPAEPGVFPESGVGAVFRDVRKYGSRFSGQMLESYAGIALNHRPAEALIYPTTVPSVRSVETPVAAAAYQAGIAAGLTVALATAAALTAQGTEAFRVPTMREMLCHPMNDPTKLYPIGVKNTSGFKLKRLPGQIVLKPGASRLIKLPVKKGFTLDIDDFCRVVDQEEDYINALNNPDYRDVSSLPKSVTIRFFRVRGDMIQSKVAAANTGDTDYQTGSCTVMFQVMRSFWMRSISQLKAKETSPLNAFDVVVTLVNQEAINDEQDAPAAVDSAGL